MGYTEKKMYSDIIIEKSFNGLVKDFNIKSEIIDLKKLLILELCALHPIPSNEFKNVKLITLKERMPICDINNYLWSNKKFRSYSARQLEQIYLSKKIIELTNVTGDPFEDCVVAFSYDEKGNSVAVRYFPEFLIQIDREYYLMDYKVKHLLI